MSDQALSADTEVVVLLCGRFGGERQEPFQPLSAREYGELAKWLNAFALRPADLMLETGRVHLPQVHDAKLELKRIDYLLGRGTALALALERWSRGGLWVISRGDPEFPKRLKRQLKHAAPPLLYGAGGKALLDAGGLAIIGSRDATEAALDFTRAVASRCAAEGMAVVSGGARGVDVAAMQGATEAGGVSIGVLSSDLLKASVNRQSRLGLQEGRLVLISPFYPEAPFNAGNAMGRNRYIYTLADQALVIDAALGSGGTWEGALENLKHQWVPLYVRTPGSAPGNAALVGKGGIAFTDAFDAENTLTEFFARAPDAEGKAATGSGGGQQLSLTVGDDAASPGTEAREPRPFETSALMSGAEGSQIAAESQAQPPNAMPGTGEASLDMYADFMARLTHALADGPLREDEVTAALGLEKGQAKVWLKKATESGRVEKLKRPLRYSLSPQSSLLC